MRDRKILSLDPAETSQRIKEHEFGGIERLTAPVAYGEKAKSTTNPLRTQTAWPHEHRSSSRYKLSAFHFDPPSQPKERGTA
uniref:Uncharacterized protein n=1 Tax=Bradyrhizobium symbiodeficiens TaxID=1404367 RepID=A0A6G9A6A3_9BRAD|nr:hypothetical protein HAV00_17005 [Bradyrhizobium symbiodeficiens]